MVSHDFMCQGDIMELRDTLKKRLRLLRTERGETQAQVAQGIGVGSQHYQKFEYGANLPNLENFIALADHFGVSLDYLAGRNEEKEPRP